MSISVIRTAASRSAAKQWTPPPTMDQLPPQVYVDRWRAHLMAELRRLQLSLGEIPPGDGFSTPTSQDHYPSPAISCKSEPRSPEQWPVTSPKIRVAVFGATGRSASSIIEALLESPSTFDVTAFSRPCSLKKPQNLSYGDRGIHVLPYDLKRPFQEALISVLKGFDVVISALGPDALVDQVPLATIAKAAGVERFVPSMFAACAPAVGVDDVREAKEEVINHIKKLGLGYTIIDTGCWYESYVYNLAARGRRVPERPNSTPPLSRSRHVIPGTGDVPGAMSSFADVGRWVARIITDPRTLNRMVFAYGAVLSANQAFGIVERIGGVKVWRSYISKDDLLEAIALVHSVIKKGGGDRSTMSRLRLAQGLYSWGIRGDNTPWNAKYLGYLDATELYPDFRPVSFDDFVREALAGRVSRLYDQAMFRRPDEFDGQHGHVLDRGVSPEVGGCPLG